MDLSRLPSITALLADPRVASLPHVLAVRAARQIVDEQRRILQRGGPLAADLPDQVLARARQLSRPRLRRVINATGIVIHTNLGRAPLSLDAVTAVADVAGGYSNVELDLESGRRGGRLAGVEAPLRQVTGAEAAIAVNNNAAAVLLVLTALARDRQVIVSRGELVEIGGSFRVPDVIAAGGARLVEVGATNRTRAADFEAAIGPDTAMLLRVHPSNFRIEGFTERPDRAALVALGRARGIPVVEDLGSGVIGDLGVAAGVAAGGGCVDEDAADRVLATGVDLVCFSGDKLLGGPQAGIIAGRADLVAACRHHPLYRALRLDKLVLAALEATLRVHAEGRAATLSVQQMLARTPEDLDAAARRIAAALPGARVDADLGYAGGGALPAQGLKTSVVVVPAADPDALAHALRTGHPAIVARITRDALRIDPRTLLPGEEDLLVARLRGLLAGDGGFGHPAAAADDAFDG